MTPRQKNETREGIPVSRMDTSIRDSAVAERLLQAPYAEIPEALYGALKTSPHGLSPAEAASRLEHYGPNTLPHSEAPGIWTVFFRQFLSPLIYILLIAAVVSLLLQEWSDATFIAAVLLINAIIGAIQEYSAEQSAAALQQLVSSSARLLRAGEAYEVDASQVVPGDIALLEPGDKVPADIRLDRSQTIQVDESLLTGESLPVHKDASRTAEANAPLSERQNMVFAGTLVTRGHRRGIVVGTGIHTELGAIAQAVLHRPSAKPPLLLRMERFTHGVAIAVLVAVVLMGSISAYQGTPLSEIFFLAVALAVSAIPEGLPVALTVALAIGMRRMARRHVIIRRLMAVEALGSCTIIASDKTGTLTVNQLTVRRIRFPGADPWEVTGEGTTPEGAILTPRGAPTVEEAALLQRLCQAVVLTNDGFVGHRDGGWVHHGDAVDVALLVMSHKAGVTRPETVNAFPEAAVVPFESERAYSASINQVDGEMRAFVKGALEKLLPMCSQMALVDGDQSLDVDLIVDQANQMAERGHRVLAVASGPVGPLTEQELLSPPLRELTLVGLIGMIDPLRTEAKAAVASCRDAGIDVAMVTGDHPTTAFAIARELALANRPEQVVTGVQLRNAAQEDPSAVADLTGCARVFARVEPQQKLDIVNALQKQGHFVAVTGDGANDAPALRAAQVGVAMGEGGHGCSEGNC